MHYIIDFNVEDKLSPRSTWFVSLRQIYTDGFTEKPFKIRKEKKERKGKDN